MSKTTGTKPLKAGKKPTITKTPSPEKFAFTRASKATPRFPSPVRTSPFRTAEHVNPGELHPFNPSTGNAQMTLEQFMGKPAITSITASGQLRFHAVGDTGMG